MKSIIDLKDLKTITLKKTENVQDSSAPVTRNLLGEGEGGLLLYHSTVLDINIEEWLDLIYEFTFKTGMVSISISEAELFVRLYEREKRELVAETISSNSALKDLVIRLQNVFDEVIGKAGGSGFIKTSCRSPKDSCSDENHLKQIFANLLEKETVKDENSKLICLLRANKQIMSVRNAKEAIDLLLHSRRTWQDYTLALKHPTRWNQHLIVRKFDELFVDLEFRCFVSKNQMTAISQYHHLCFFNFSKERQEELSKQIQEFFINNIRDRLASKFTSYVIDIGFTRAEMKPVVIELNPFLETTDGCCFDWNKERKLLEENDKVVFRVRERPLIGAKSMLYDRDRVIFESVA